MPFLATSQQINDYQRARYPFQKDSVFAQEEEENHSTIRQSIASFRTNGIIFAFSVSVLGDGSWYGCIWIYFDFSLTSEGFSAIADTRCRKFQDMAGSWSFCRVLYRFKFSVRVSLPHGF